MRAIIYRGPGALEFGEREAPVARPGEVVVEVAYVGICGSDLLMWEGGFDRVRPPVTMGHEFSGRVVAIGEGVELPLGQRVAVMPLISCGRCAPCRAGRTHVCETLGLYGIDRDGGAAELVRVPAASVYAIPDSLGLREAALVEPTAVAHHMVRRAAIGAGSHVLVVGGGPIGALLALVGIAVEAASVRVSEPNPDRRSLLESLGISVIDPTGREISELVSDIPDGPDVVVELTGLGIGLDTALRAAATGATVLLGGLAHAPLPVATSVAVFKELQLVGARVYEAEDFAQAVSLLAAGAVPGASLITRVVPLEDAVDNAYGRLRTSPTDMKILIEANGAPA
ncbi:zinc-binding dehydrogenase [Microbacterium sp. NPDC078428]|uniref:zinc-binding dehydrogenase n=1 Tax=Microbacterium sp. NPDC078428 TaxID=3364190 RepID=UPI0037C85C19